jgi:hypothetical protein
MLGSVAPSFKSSEMASSSAVIIERHAAGLVHSTSSEYVCLFAVSNACKVQVEV